MPPATAGDDSFPTPAEAVQRRAPVMASNAYTPPSMDVSYRVRPTTTGSACTPEQEQVIVALQASVRLATLGGPKTASARLNAECDTRSEEHTSELQSRLHLA